jgi:hypothetical protein
MSEQQETYEEQGGLPPEFWTQPEALIQDPALKLVYAELSRRMREDLRLVKVPTTLEYMLAERTTALYMHIRQKETTSSFAHDRAYKETMQLWVQMASQLRQHEAKASDDPEAIRRQVLKDVAKAITQVTTEMPEDLGRKVRAQLIDALG